MLHTISSDKIALTVSSKGGEPQSIIKDGHEFLWQGDKTWWNRRAPVLFPLVGGLPGGSIHISGKPYSISKHGFARDCEFELTEKSGSEMILTLPANDYTKGQYPFEFDFVNKISVEGNKVNIHRTILNKGNSPMPFVIGEHPGFICPMEEGLSFEDYSLTFEHDENGISRRIDGSGLMKDGEQLIFKGRKMPVKSSLFEDDALIFSHFHSKSALLSSEKGSHSVKVSWDGYDYLGIWAPKTKDGIKAPFLCIEPWTGVNCRPTDINYEDKEGVYILKAGESKNFNLSFEVR